MRAQLKVWREKLGVTPVFVTLVVALIGLPFVVFFAVDPELKVRPSAGGWLALGAYLLFLAVALVAALRECLRSNVRLQQAKQQHQRTRLELEQQRQNLQSHVDDLLTKTTVLEKAPFGIVIADTNQEDMPIVYANDAFCRITGYGRAEVLGRNCRFLTGPETDAVASANIRQALAAHTPIEVEVLNYRRDGAKFCNRLLLFPCFNQAGALSHYVGCIYDITDFKLATQEKKRLESELQESLKLESLSLTIAGIAHDLNTPVGIALTASSHLGKTVRQMQEKAAQGPASPEELEHWAATLDRGSKLVLNNLGKAADLVRSFKQTTSDATRVEWRKVALKELLESLLVAISPLMKRSQCEVSLLCPEHLTLFTEPGSVSQVLTNLMVNASIHAFEGRQDRRICIEVTPHADGVRIVVQDNGNGMSQEAVARAFEPFFTTRRGQGGSGLGLFSARRLVEHTLGGKISLQTQQGQGTTFMIELPSQTAPKSVAG